MRPRHRTRDDDLDDAYAIIELECVGLAIVDLPGMTLDVWVEIDGHVQDPTSDNPREAREVITGTPDITGLDCYCVNHQCHRCSRVLMPKEVSDLVLEKYRIGIVDAVVEKYGGESEVHQRIREKAGY